jgi:hypothetical protein
MDPDLGKNQRTALLLAGTVTLPSPFPAMGRVSLVVDPRDPAGKRPSIVKIEHKLNDMQIISWFVNESDIRACRVPPAAGTSVPLEEWRILTSEEVGGKIEDERTRLAGQSPQPGQFDEPSLYDAAIVHVPETARVLVRVEAGVAAAVGTDAPAFLNLFAGRICCLPR